MSSTLDAASILFPDDVPAAQRTSPDWFKAELGAAELRLMGKAGPEKPDAANAIFPNEAPKDTSVNPEDPVEKKLFPEDAAINVEVYEQTVRGELTGTLADAIQGGREEQAAELRVAIDGLSKDFAKAGTDQQTITEALRIVKGDTWEQPSSEQVEADFQECLSSLPALGVTDDDLRVARLLVNDLEIVSPGVKRSLESSGKGNDIKLIKMAVAEARRRGYR